MLITVIRPVKIGGYSTLTLGHAVLGQWTVSHAAEDGKTRGSRDLLPSVEVFSHQPRFGDKFKADGMRNTSQVGTCFLHSSTVPAECAFTSFGTVHP